MTGASPRKTTLPHTKGKPAMSAVQQFKLSGTALPKDARGMLDEICEHFIEHAEVQR